MILALLARVWPFIACLSLGLGAGGYVEKNRWQAKYSALQAAHSQELADYQQKAREALQDQIDARFKTETNNGHVIQSLQEERDHAVSARLIAERLLAAAQAGPSTGAAPVPTADHQPGTPRAPEGGGDQSITEVLAAAAADCRDAIQRFAALQQQIIPQLTR